jgi:hypothetical protein
MTNIVSIEGSAETPKSKACWSVDVGDGSPQQQLAYVNLVYDLIAVALGKLGIHYSQWIVGDINEDEFHKVMDDVRRSLI